MKILIIFLSGFIFSSINLFSQPYFQKITNGPIVNTLTKGNISAWGDYDNDGFQDLVISYLNDDCITCSYPLNFYKNNGDGSFTRIYDNVIAQTSVSGSGLAWADYDNDGYLDLFVCGGVNSRNKLFHNEQNGNFSVVNTGIVVNDNISWSQACAWTDYNKDGWIDLFVANRNNQSNFLYKNTGNGNFMKILTGSIVNDVGASRSCSWGDYDNNGWPDLFVLNYDGQNDYLYHNNGDETFTKITNLLMVNDFLWGNSCGWIDYDNNGYLDLFVTNGGANNNNLFYNQGNGIFILNNSVLCNEGNSHGFGFGDFDNDGFEDFFICNKNRINSLFKNNGGSFFTKITNEIVSQEGGNSSIAASMVDYNNDGKLDLFVTNRFSNLYNYLYKNTGANYNFITIKLKGCISNKNGIGARIKIIANGNQQIKEVSSGTGWGSQCALWPHFGLGAATIIDSVIVYWPSDSVTKLTNVPINQILKINECGAEVIGINNNVSKSLQFRLDQNYPNPFNPVTKITYEIPVSTHVSLKVYDVLGNEVVVLVNENQEAGKHEVYFDSQKISKELSSGIYFYKIESGDFISTQKMTLLK